MRLFIFVLLLAGGGGVGVAVIEFWLYAVGYSRCKHVTVACAASVNISLRFLGCGRFMCGDHEGKEKMYMDSEDYGSS